MTEFRNSANVTHRHSPFTVRLLVRSPPTALPLEPRRGRCGHWSSGRTAVTAASGPCKTQDCGSRLDPRSSQRSYRQGQNSQPLGRLALCIVRELHPDASVGSRRARLLIGRHRVTWLVWAALRRVDRCSFRDTPARWLSVSLPNEYGEPPNVNMGNLPAHPRTRRSKQVTKPPPTEPTPPTTCSACSNPQS